MSADVPPLVHQLGGRSKPMAQLKAARSLATLCHADAAARAAAVAAGTVPHLIKLLASPTAAVQEQSAKALASLSLSPDTAAEVGAAGAIPALVQLLGSRSDFVQEAAAVGLTMAVAHGGAANKARATAAGALLPLMQLLGSPSAAVQLSAARALVCAGHDAPDARAILAGPSFAPLLVRLLMSGPPPKPRLLLAILHNHCSVPSGVQRLVDAGVIRALVWQVRAATPGKGAAAALAAFCAGEPERKAQALAAGAVPALLKLVGQEEGAVALAVLCSPPGAAAEDVKIPGTGTARCLVQLLGCSLPEVRVHALAALEVCNSEEVVAAGAIWALVRLLGDRDEELAGLAAVTISTAYCGSAAASAAAAAAGAIPALVPLLHSNAGRGPARGTRTMCNAATAMYSLCAGSTDNQAAAVRAGAIEPLLEQPAVPACWASATPALSAMRMESAAVQLAFATTGDVPLLVRQLGSPSSRIRTLVASMLRTMFTRVAERGVPAAMQPSLPLLKVLLDYQAEEVREVAAVVALATALLRLTCLGQLLVGTALMEQDDEGQAAPAGAAAAMPPPGSACQQVEGAMRQLAAMVLDLRQVADNAPPGGSGQQEAAGSSVLSKVHRPAVLCAESAHQLVTALTPGGRLDPCSPESAAALRAELRQLVSCVLLLLAFLAKPGADSTSALIAHAAIRAVLFFGDDCIFFYPDIVHLLVPMLASPIPTRLASEAAFSFSTSARHRGRLAAEGAVPALVQQLSGDCGEVQRLCVGALCNVSADAEGQAAVAAAAGALPALVQLLGCGVEEVQHNAACTLMNVFSNAGAKAAAVVAGAIPALVWLLGSASDAVRGQAAGALASLCHHAEEEVCLKVARGGAIHALVQLLASSSAAAQQQAAEALMNFTALQDNRPAVTSSGAIPVLVQLLGSPSAAVQLRACGTLRNLCCISGDQAPRAVTGAVPALVRLLDSSSAEVQEMAAAALRNLLFHTSAWRDGELHQASLAAITAMVRLLESASEAAQEHAAGALRNISFNTATCPLLVSAGAVPALERLVGCAPAAVLNEAVGALDNIQYARTAVLQKAP